ncbi:hypothetical protein AtubIFM56815_005910 [Aspergillus tubingensis]|uniref:Uncharacterized protein n=1 Tax=Aspergillus tubingensis TaxID=5068 RepID=A0A9W6ESC1_ASPTU|nr:hypothetical protein AtubIFM56815_005910 [Aspergillus tubingensis]
MYFPSQQILQQYLDDSTHWKNNSWAQAVSLTPAADEVACAPEFPRIPVKGPEYPVEYCLSRKLTEQCELQFSPAVCLVVIVCNLFKIASLAIALEGLFASRGKGSITSPDTGNSPASPAMDASRASEAVDSDYWRCAVAIGIWLGHALYHIRTSGFKCCLHVAPRQHAPNCRLNRLLPVQQPPDTYAFGRRIGGDWARNLLSNELETQGEFDFIGNYDRPNVQPSHKLARGQQPENTSISHD